MKKGILILLSAALLLLAGCAQTTDSPAQTATEASEQAQPETAAQQAAGSSAEVIDLTKLSSTMVYSEVFNMLADPDRYVGKTVRMNGISACFTNPQTNQLYYACIIADATGCCAQGLEYVLPEGEVYPDLDTSITVTGTFALYTENGYKCFHLVDARLI